MVLAEISQEDLKKLLASYVRLLHSKHVLVKEDYEVLEIIDKLMGEKDS